MTKKNKLTSLQWAMVVYRKIEIFFTVSFRALGNVFKKLGKGLWHCLCFLENKVLKQFSHLIQTLILVAAVITLILTLNALGQTERSNDTAQETASTTLRAVKIANEELQIFKSEIAKQNDPFLNYTYLPKEEAFTIIVPENINIEEVWWYWPDVIGHPHLDGFMKNFKRIDRVPIKLTLDEIKNYLLDQLKLINNELTDEQALSYLKCVFNCNHQNSVITTILYKKRGESKTRLLNNFLYISLDIPKVMALSNIDHPDINRQFFDIESQRKRLESSKNRDWTKLSNEQLNLIIEGKAGCNKWIWGECPLIYF